MKITYYAMNIDKKTGLCFGTASFNSVIDARAYAHRNGWNRIACAVNGKFYCDCKL